MHLPCLNACRLRCLLALSLLIAGCGRLGFDAIPRASEDAGEDLGAITDADNDANDDGADAFDLDASDDASDDATMDGGDGDTDADSDMGPLLVPGILVDPIDGLTTTEMGGMATFTVVLRAPPISDVTVSVVSLDVTEGTVAPASLTFTSENWNAPQTVTATGEDDPAADGAIEYTISTEPAVSLDANYSGYDADDVLITNVDDETPGVTVNPTSDLVTSESGGDDSFTVVLNAAPSADVSISLGSSDDAEATVVPPALTFTTANWNAPQTVTVTGVDDADQDGDAEFTVLTSACTSEDAAYDGVDVDDVTGRNRDDESAGLIVEVLGDAATSEAGGSVSISIVLQSQPVADVMLAIESSDETEGTVATASVVFSPTDWNIPHALTITGEDDAIIDGDQAYTISIGPSMSADPYYDGLVTPDVALINRDDDTPGYTITELTDLSTTEGGGTAQFSIVLNSQPTANVIFQITSSDTTEVAVINPNPTLQRTTWYVPLVVTLAGVNDSVADGNQLADIQVHVQLSADANYMALSDTHLSVTNIDDETPGVTVTPSVGLSTSEAGGTATFTVVLNSQPSAPVSLGFSSDTLTEGTVSPASVMFTTFNWSSPRTVTVTGANDLIADGARVYHIVTAPATSADPAYMGLNPVDVTLTNTDNDTAGLIVTPTSVIAPETGTPATFTIALRSQPTASVTVPLHMLDVAQGTLAPASLTFTTGNWSTPQAVMVTGVADGVPDGIFINTAFTDPCTTTDMTYAGLDGADVTVAHTEMAGISVTPTSGLMTSEAGGTATFTVVLTTAPLATVTMYVYSNSEGSPQLSSSVPLALAFSTANWNVPQTVTIYGKDDIYDDGDVVSQLVIGPASSSDAGYNGLNPPDVTFTNVDNDTAAITITPVGLAQTTENGGVATFRLSASVLSTSVVTLSFSVSDPSEGGSPQAGNALTSTLVTTLSPSYTHTIYVRGLDDYLIDGDVTYSLITNVTSADPGYAAVSVAPIDIVNIDNDSGDILVSPNTTLVSDAPSSTGNVAMVLTRAPSANVVVGLSSSDTSEITVTPAMLTFTPLNWSTPQWVAATGVVDGIVDGNQTATIVTAAAVSADGTFSGQNALDATVTIVDRDSERGVSVAGNYAMVGGYLGQGGMRSLSYDGQFVSFDTFYSYPGDTNGSVDVYVRDRTMHTESRASLTSAGGQTAGAYSSLSRDGRFVAFYSWLDTVVPGDNNGAGDVFVRDRNLNTTERVSLSSTGTQLPTESIVSDISGDGRFVLFTALAAAVPTDTNNAYDVYVRDRTLATTTRVSVSSTGAQGTYGTTGGSLSADGRYVAFTTQNSFAPADTGLNYDVYVRDTVANTTTFASVSMSGGSADRPSGSPAISDDGRYVAFSSAASNLTPGVSTMTIQHIYVRDLMLGTTTLVDVSTDGTLSNASSNGVPSISDDGNRVFFITGADNLVGDDTNGVNDAFVRDRMAGTTTLVSRSPSGVVSNGTPGGLYNGSISGDGHTVVFLTDAGNIIDPAWDTNLATDVYCVYVP